MAEKIAVTFTVDVSGALTARALHEVLARELQFPAYYGHNWDAFDECIGSDLQRPAIVRIRGLTALKQRLPHDAALLLSCLVDAKSQGGLDVEVI